MKKTEPLIVHLFDMLNEGSRLRMNQIQKELGLSERQSRRIVKNLCKKYKQVKIKVEGRFNVYFIPEKERLTKSHLIDFTEEELWALTVAAEAARASLSQTPFSMKLGAAMDKILSAYAEDFMTFEPENLPAKWHFGGNNVTEIPFSVFKVLREALNANQTVKMIYYTASKGQLSSWREIDPLITWPKNGSWYVAGYCHRGKCIKDFSLARIKDIALVDKAYFGLPEGFSKSNYFADRFGSLAGGKLETVEIIAPIEVANYFIEKKYHPSQITKVLKNGDVQVTYQISGLEEIRSFVQGWGSKLKVIKPQKLREIIRQDAIDQAKLYS